MKPVLAIDMDSTLMNHFDTWAWYFNIMRERYPHPHFETCLSPPPTWDHYGTVCRACKNYCVNSKHILLQSTVMDGGDRAVRRLYQDFELHLVTHRPEHLYDAICDLLHAHNVLLFFTSLHVSWDDKRMTCEKLGAVALIDDGPRNIESVRESAVTTPIIFDQPYNRHVHGQRLTGWHDVERVREMILLAQGEKNATTQFDTGRHR